MTQIKDEKGVKRAVKRLLSEHQWFHWMPAANGYGASGTADILALRSGVFLAVETKFKYNKPSVMQVKFLRNVLAQSSFGFVVNEKTIPTFEQWLSAFDRACIAASKNERVDPDDGAKMLHAIQMLTAPVSEKANATKGRKSKDKESPQEATGSVEDSVDQEPPLA